MTDIDAVLARWQMLGDLVAEAHACGVEFRLRGGGVAFAKLEGVPADLVERLHHHASGLYTFLDGPRNDKPILAFARKLGVRARLVAAPEAIPEALVQVDADAALHDDVIAIDFETAPDPPYAVPGPAIRFLQGGILAAKQPKNKDKTALDPHRASIHLVSLYAGGSHAFLFHGEATIIALLASAWLQQAHLVVHNSVFELKFLQAFRATHACEPVAGPRGRIECTMQAVGLVCGVSEDENGSSGYGRKLEEGARKLLGLELPKQLQTSDWSAVPLSKAQLAYATVDAVVCWQLWQDAHGLMQRDERMGAYALQRGAAPAVADMQRRGALLDRAAHRLLCEQWTADLHTARKNYTDEAHKPPPDTPAETVRWLQTLLTNEEQAAWPRTRKTGELSTKAKFVKRLGLHHPQALRVVEIMKAKKLLSTFGLGLLEHINPVTGRIHSGFIIGATRAGRFSAKDPNLQQLPKASSFRRCIIGDLLVRADFNQIELRALAWLAEDDEMNGVYANGGDLHYETAATISSLPVEQISGDLRSRAKAVNFGSIYGIGPRGLVEYAYDNFGVIIDEHEAAEFLAAFFRRFWKVAQWRDRQIEWCLPRGEIRVASGRSVRAEWERTRHISRQQCLNIPVQGIAADCMLLAIRYYYALLQRHRIRGGMIATVHDEILAEVVAADAEAARELLQQAMVQAFTTTFPGAPTVNVVDARIGNSWGDFK
jgi:DNA polymerase-1